MNYSNPSTKGIRTGTWSARWLLLVLFLNPHGLFAQPALESLLPRSVKIGTESEITATGKFENWPVKIWCNRPGLTFELGVKGKLTVTASKEAAAGVYLIRFLDQNGASEPIPLIVDSIFSKQEKEPNESPKNSQPVWIPANVSGVLGKNGDVDCYAVLCEQGQTLVAKLTANPWFGKSMDAIIQICDSRGFVMDQNDDSIGLDPKVSVKIPVKGKYFVRVFAFPATPNSSIRFAGGADYRYLLTLSNRGLLGYVRPWNASGDTLEPMAFGIELPTDLPLKHANAGPGRKVFYSQRVAGFFETNVVADTNPNAQPQQTLMEADLVKSKPLDAPFELFGSISNRGQIDLIKFHAKKGKKLRFQIESRRFGMEMDPQLTIFNESGKSLVNKDDNSKTDPDVTMDFLPPVDGVYYLRIRDAADDGGDQFHYRLGMQEVRPKFNLTLTKSSYEFAVGSKLEIEVDVARTDGFSQPIEVRLEGLASSVVTVPGRSENKGPTVKKVKLIVDCKEPFQSECRIVGRAGKFSKKAKFVCPSGVAIEKIFVTAKDGKKNATK